MYQGETITTTIIGFPVPVSEIKSLYIVFKNKFRVLLEKTLDDCTILEDGRAILLRRLRHMKARR